MSSGSSAADDDNDKESINKVIRRLRVRIHCNINGMSHFVANFNAHCFCVKYCIYVASSFQLRLCWPTFFFVESPVLNTVVVQRLLYNILINLYQRILSSYNATLQRRNTIVSG
jgi:hypothetical protein